MNLVNIEYSHVSSRPEISINGEKISSYSEMTMLINRPFHEIQGLILSTLDKEIFDFYEVEFKGFRYQYEALNFYRKQSQYCKVIHYEETKVNFSSRNRYDFFYTLIEKYQLQAKLCNQVKLFSTSEAVLLATNENILICGSEEADLGIYMTGEEDVIANVNTKVSGVIGEQLFYKKEKEKEYFYFPKSTLIAFLNYYLEYCHQAVLIETVLELLQSTRLTAKEKVALDAYVSDEPAYYLGEVPGALDVAEDCNLDFASYPEEAFLLKGKGECISIEKENKIRALKSGIGLIEIINREGDVVESREITVVQHNYVKEIRVISKFSHLNVHEKGKIEILVIPPDAEDADELKWKSFNPAIAYVKENGEVVALERGKTKIEISGKKISQTIDVEVKPQLKALRFAEQQIRMRPGEYIIIECMEEPIGASCENVKWSFDNEMIASCSPSFDGRRCKLQAKKEYTGKGNLRCFDPERRVGAVCNIEVSKKGEKDGLKKGALVCWVLGFFWPFLLIISAVLSGIGITQSTNETDRKSFKTYLIGSLVTLGTIIFLAILIILGNQ